MVFFVGTHRRCIRESSPGCDLDQRLQSVFYWTRYHLTSPSSPPFRKVISSHRRLCGEITATIPDCVCLSRTTGKHSFCFLKCSGKGLTFWRIRIELQIAQAEIAQLVEHAAENRSVRSSILRLGINVSKEYFKHIFLFPHARREMLLDVTFVIIYS